jgi:hypothetical protein
LKVPFDVKMCSYFVREYEKFGKIYFIFSSFTTLLFTLNSDVIIVRSAPKDLFSNNDKGTAYSSQNLLNRVGMGMRK